MHGLKRMVRLRKGAIQSRVLNGPDAEIRKECAD